MCSDSLCEMKGDKDGDDSEGHRLTSVVITVMMMYFYSECAPQTHVLCIYSPSWKVCLSLSFSVSLSLFLSLSFSLALFVSLSLSALSPSLSRSHCLSIALLLNCLISVLKFYLSFSLDKVPLPGSSVQTQHTQVDMLKLSPFFHLHNPLFSVRVFLFSPR